MELRYKDGTPMRKYNSPKLQEIEMENKQTAVEWLVEMLIDNKYLIKDATHLFEQAKQIEKEQMDNCWRFGRGSYIDKEPETFEQYYKETFGNK